MIVAMGGSRRPPAAVLAVAAMLSVQVGAAASTSLFDDVGPAGTAWLRLTWAAVFFVAVARPKLRALPASTLRVAVALGVTTGVMTVCFLQAIDRIDLGTAAAIEFLGPLTVAVVRRSSRLGLVWPIVAAVGVLALTEPWTGETDPAGVTFAAVAAVAWASYILLTQKVGDALRGVQGLAISMPVAAGVAALVGVPGAIGNLSLEVLAISAGLALMLPVIPFSLELGVLRRLTTAAFGTLMSLEPAVGVLVGFLLLNQDPNPLQVLGVLLVVIAGIGAERGGRRTGSGTPGEFLDR
jgi:inner membrane transporter RhtA